MNYQHKTKESLIIEVEKLKQENETLKALNLKSKAECNCLKEALNRNASMLKLALETGNMAWWEMNVASGNVFFDKRKAEMLGYPSEKFNHYKDFTDLLHPDDYEKTMQAMEDYFEGNSIKYKAEYRFLADSGEYIWFHDFGAVMKRDANGKPLICAGFVVDINERKQAENELRKKEERLKIAQEIAQIGFIDWNLKTNELYCSDEVYYLYGLSLAEKPISFEKITTGLHPDDREFVQNNLDMAVHNGKEFNIDHRILRPDGKIIWVHAQGQMLSDLEGKNETMLGTIINITERKKAEEMLIKSKKQKEYLIKAIPDMIFSINEQGVFIDFHAEARNTLLVLPEFFIGKHFKEILPPDVASSLEGFIKNVIKTSDVISLIYDLMMPDGIVNSFEARVSVMPNHECIAIVRDITERKQVEEVLQKSEHMLKTVLDNFPGLVFWKDKQSNYLGCNHNFATGAGLNSPAEIVGKTDFDLPWGATEGKNYRTIDFKVMKSGKPKMHIVEMQHQVNGQVVWLDTNKMPLLDSRGEVIGLIGVSTDISMIKKTEQELIIANKELTIQNEEKVRQAVELIKAKENAEESNRLKTAFLNNISHEIRTPFSGLLGFLAIIQDVNHTKAEKDEYIVFINKSADRLMNTINDIVEISQIQTGQAKLLFTEINIKILVVYLFEHFKDIAECKGLNFIYKNTLQDKHCHIKTDSNKLSNVISSLINNAIKFTNDGSIEFGISKNQDYLEFYVKDTGIGIPENLHLSIFDRFMQADVSNTRSFEGSGLGLSIAKAYVEMLGGFIWLESESGKGSTFYFTIPYIAGTAE